MNHRVDIVLATYNGQEYLREQLSSIVSSPDFSELIRNIIITDDGSSDATLSIVEDFNSEKILVVENSLPSGPANNFINGIKFSDADYVMFCDQDDVWDDDKIGLFLNEAVVLKSHLPGAVYSDLRVVDEKLELINDSFFDNERISSDWGCFVSNLAFQNIAPGCAMLINKECVKTILSTYNINVVMHDWWALLYASLYSNVVVIEKPTISYRQHNNNAVGATRRNAVGGWIKGFTRKKGNLYRTVRQAVSFYNTLTEEQRKNFSPHDLKFFENLANAHTNLSSKLSIVLSKKSLKSTFLRDIVTRILFLRW